ELHDVLKRRRDMVGAIPGAFEAWLALRGLRTLALRVERAGANAAELARRLETHPSVDEVRYPGFGAMISIVLADADQADRPTHAVGVVDGERVVAYAEIVGPKRGDAAVHPDFHGRGIGTWLAHWMQDRARELGHPEIGIPVPVGSPGEALMRGLGYHERW